MVNREDILEALQSYKSFGKESDEDHTDLPVYYQKKIKASRKALMLIKDYKKQSIQKQNPRVLALLKEAGL